MNMSQVANRTESGRGWLAALGGPLLIVTALSLIIGLVSPADDDGKARPDSQGTPHAQAARVDHDSPVWSLAFSAHDTYLASATVSGEVWVNNLAGGQRTLVERGPMSSAQSVAFSPDGHILAVAGSGSVRFVDLTSNRMLDPLTSERGLQAAHVAFSHGGSLLAVGGTKGSLSLWHWPSRRKLAVLSGHRGGVNSVDFSADDSVFASADSEGLVKLWSVAEGKERLTFRAHAPGHAATEVKFSPDGALLATASYLERTVRLWTASGGESRVSFPRTVSGCRALAFSPDGAILAVAHGDGTLMLWSVAEGRQLAPMVANERSLQSLAFSRDGRYLATGGADGCLRLWDVSAAISDSLLAPAPVSRGLNLTQIGNEAANRP
jgi:WD40 repeat protein